MRVSVTYRGEFTTEVEVSSLEGAQAAAEKARWRRLNELHPSFFEFLDEDGFEIRCPHCGSQKIVDGEDSPKKCLACNYTW